MTMGAHFGAIAVLLGSYWGLIGVFRVGGVTFSGGAPINFNSTPPCSSDPRQLRPAAAVSAGYIPETLLHRRFRPRAGLQRT